MLFEIQSSCIIVETVNCGYFRISVANVRIDVVVFGMIYFVICASKYTYYIQYPTWQYYIKR